MSIQSEIDRIEQAVSDTYDVLEAEGAAMPGARTVANLAATAADIKAVQYGKAQSLSDAEKQQARANIGAGTSDFSGSYNDLTNKPTIPSAYTHPSTHAASMISAGTFAGQVVANSSGQAPGTSLLRNSKIVAEETTPTVNGEIFWVRG